MKNKKSQVSEQVIWVIPEMIFLIAILFAYVILVKALIITNIDVREVESSILVNRLLFTQDGFLYYDDEIERLYPGIIVLNKFEDIAKNNPNILDNEVMSYGSDNPIIAANITLKRENKEDVTIYYNKEKFDRWKPRVLRTVKGGAGSVEPFKKQRYVLVKEGEILSPAILHFFIIS